MVMFYNNWQCFTMNGSVLQCLTVWIEMVIVWFTYDDHMRKLTNHHNHHYHHHHPQHCTHPSAADCIWGGWPSIPRRSSRTHGPEFAEIRIFNRNLRCFYFISIFILYIQIRFIFSTVEQIFIKALSLTIHQLLWTDL